MLAALAIVQAALPLIPIPLGLIPAANVVVSVLVVSLPVFALFAGASLRWNWSRALATVALGVVLQFGLALLSRMIPPPLGLLGFALSQTGLVLWCLGVGAFLASILKDRNLLLPIAVFLALFDIWLVFVPDLMVSRIVHGNQQKLAAIAFQVPQVASVVTTGHAAPLAYIGPADFLFMAMFFVALFRFGMRTRETLRALVPTLIAYLLVVLLLGSVSIGPISLRALPALVPIGAVVLLVNWREFRLSRDEKQTTIVLAALGIALLAWRFWVHR